LIVLIHVDADEPAVTASDLTGRISAGPSELLDQEILRPQFSHEVARLLPWHVAAEKVLLAEYLRMGLLNARQTHQIGCLLDSVDEADLVPEPGANMSDLALPSRPTS
jgi:argininosuccinate lyase